MRRILSILAFALLLVCAAIPAPAQEYRGQISGKILDPSGATIPGAQITVTNASTNASSSTLANDAGVYTVLYLVPGQYTITVEASGFKKLVRQGVTVRVGDVLSMDMTMEIGGSQEIVNVNAEAPLLNTQSAAAGQVIDQKRISDLPLSDGNPFILHRLAGGVTYTGDLKFSRPFDNAGTTGIVVDGAPGVPEFTLDGSPNMASGNRVAFVPPSDVVQEFRVGTASFDAQDGHSASASVNVTMKSGTNRLHGTLYEFVRNDKLSANDFFLNRGGQPRAQLRYNRYGGSVGGPIRLPMLYNGKNRTFFFFAYEGIKDRFPEPTLETVPTDAERKGDFSALLALGSSYQLYNPTTATKLANGRIQRDPFPGNIIPTSLISPVALKYLEYYPHANTAGDSQGRNNYQSPQVRGDDFHSESYRFDHQLTDGQHLFFRYTHNWRRESRGNWSGTTDGIHAIGNYLFRVNNGGTFDHVYTISSSTVLNYRVGFQRFSEPNIRQHEGLVDPAVLGFSSQTVSFFGGARYLPRFDIGGMSLLGQDLAGPSTHNIYSFQPTLTKILGGGKHQVRLGYDFRTYRENAFSLGHAAGLYTFRTNFTRGPLDNSPSAPIGQDLASFLLGLPTGGQIDRNAARSNQTLYHGVFVQDDWKVSSKLTLNLGLRYEYEGPTTERYNRNILGFDPTATSPIEAAARTAYAFNPIPELPAGEFKVKGGYLFTSDSSRGFWNADTNNVQPRLGFAYRMANTTVIRGGWAIYMVPYVISGVRQDGFSQATNIVPTLDSGLTFVANLTDPFPGGVTNPPGSGEGLSTFLGRDINFTPLDRVNGLSQRWEIGFQHQLPRQWTVELSYVGNRGYDLATGYSFNEIPRQYLSTSNTRDQATIDFLSANVTNPFRGLIPGTGLNGSTTSRGQLLRPFPEFTNVNGNLQDGSSTYHSGQLRLEKRFSQGYTLLANYTYSRFMRELDRLNATDPNYDRRLDDNDATNRLVMSGIWDMPFGKGRMWGTTWHGVTEAILGGWQVDGIFQAQTGRPILFGTNLFFSGDAHSIAISGGDRTVDRWFATDGFEKASNKQPGSNIRTAPRVFPDVRAEGLNLWDISILKNIRIGEGVTFQMRGEFLNAFNHPQFDNPNVVPTNSNFGRITSQTNLPRNVQIGLKLVF